MKKVFVQYQVKADQVTENEQLVQAVYRQLSERKPEGLRYATYKLADGVSFVHIAVSETEEAHEILTNLPAFRNFQATIKDRCEKQPVVQAVTEIGSYQSMKEAIEKEPANNKA